MLYKKSISEKSLLTLTEEVVTARINLRTVANVNQSGLVLITNELSDRIQRVLTEVETLLSTPVQSEPTQLLEVLLALSLAKSLIAPLVRADGGCPELEEAIEMTARMAAAPGCELKTRSVAAAQLAGMVSLRHALKVD